MRIPFDLKYRPQIESGEYMVETRDGNKATIICWDKKEAISHKIVALVEYEDGVMYHGTFEIDGRFWENGESDNDLFIIIPDTDTDAEYRHSARMLSTAINTAFEEGKSEVLWNPSEYGLHHWQPTLEQMSALKSLADGHKPEPFEWELLESLYHELLKHWDDEK